MSQTDQPQSPGLKPLTPGEELGHALQAFAQQVMAEAMQLDNEGRQRLVINLPQLLIDVRTIEVKLQALYEELGREQMIDPAAVHKRTVRLLELRTRELRQAIAARPNIAIAQHLAGVNGRNLG
jgi:hypothetical protein